MEKFTTHRGLVAPLPQKDVDTDMIIPAQYLTSTSRGGYGENLFRRLRDSQPDFFLNLPRFAQATIIVAADNFGCGSSREHAVWALKEAGIRAIISTSFADIFSSNASKNGLLLVSLTSPVVEELIQEASKRDVYLEIDLEGKCVRYEDERIVPFDYDPFSRHCLLNGLDEMDYLLSSLPEIAEYRSHREVKRYYSTLVANR